VGLVGEYARDWRLVRAVNLDMDTEMENELKYKDYSSRRQQQLSQLRLFKRDQSGGDHVRFVAVRGERIYVSNTHALRVFGMNGYFAYAVDGLSRPAGMSFDANGRLYVADEPSFYSPSIKCFYPNDDGDYGSMRYFNRSPVSNLTGICCSKPGNLYVCEGTSVTVLNEARKRHRRFTPTATVWYQPWAVAVSATKAFVTCVNFDAVVIFNLDGTFVSRFGKSGTHQGQFIRPLGVVYHSKNDHFLICDSHNKRVQIFSVQGAFLDSISLPYEPLDVCIDPTSTDGLVYVCGANVVSVFAY